MWVRAPHAVSSSSGNRWEKLPKWWEIRQSSAKEKILSISAKPVKLVRFDWFKGIEIEAFTMYQWYISLYCLMVSLTPRRAVEVVATQPHRCNVRTAASSQSWVSSQSLSKKNIQIAGGLRYQQIRQISSGWSAREHRHQWMLHKSTALRCTIKHLWG